MKMDHEFYWELLQHEDNLFSNRTNFLIVAQTVFLGAAGAVYGSDRTTWVTLWLALIGISLCCLWFCTNCHHSQITQNIVKTMLIEAEKSEYVAHRRWTIFRQKRMKKITQGTHFYLGCVFPWIFITSWVGILILYAAGK